MGKSVLFSDNAWHALPMSIYCLCVNDHPGHPDADLLRFEVLGDRFRQKSTRVLQPWPPTKLGPEATHVTDRARLLAGNMLLVLPPMAASQDF